MSKNTAVCTVAPKSRLGYVRTLYKSLRKRHDTLDFYLLLLDQAGDSFNIKKESFKVIQLSELDNISCPPSLFFEYDLKELENAFKPYFFENLFKNFSIHKLIYFDPEVLVLNNLSLIWDLLEKNSLVLASSFTRAAERDIRPSEIDILNAGTFRQGFIGMSNTATTLSFLRDQQKYLFNFCTLDPQKVVDIRPRKLGSLSWILKEVCLLDNFAYYVSYCALQCLATPLVMKEGNVTIGDQPLLSFNFRGVNLENLENDVKDQRQIEACRHLFDQYQHLLKVNGQHETEKWSYTYDFFDNGVRIPALARKLYRDCKEKGVFFESPFLTGGENTFFSWLNEPVNASSKERFSEKITHLMWEIYESRTDLRKLFSDPLVKDKETFLTWFEKYGLQEYQIDKRFLPKFQIKNFLENLIYFIHETRKFFLWFVTYSIPQFLKRARVRAIASSHSFLQKQKTFMRLLAFRRLGELQTKHSGLPFGVNIVGVIRGEFGIGEAARSSIHALQSADVPCAVNNIDLPFHRNADSSFTKFSRVNPYCLNLIHVNAPEIKEIIHQKGKQYLIGKYNIGFWFWELSCFPEEWLPFFQYYDEVWVASRFCQESVSKVSPIPVIRMTLPVILEGKIEKNRSKFSLPEDDFIFLFTFDFRSSFERKNPLAIIEAFSTAFNNQDQALLVIKTINANDFPAKKTLLQNAVKGKQIHLIEGHLNSNDLISLTACCDCFVSLHRSEGLGMGMAKSMYLGKPVIATGYSGNMDFMSSENSFLVKHDLVEIIEDDGPYKRGNVWADPDIDHAAQLMQLVYNDRRLSERKSRQAAQDVRNLMDPKRAGTKMMERLRSIAENQ